MPGPAEELAGQAQSGGNDAFGELVERFHAPLYRFLLVRTGDPSDAEELTQEAFLRAWRNLERYDRERPFRPWLFALAGRLAVSRLRQRGARGGHGVHERHGDGQEAGGEDPSGAEPDPAALALEREERANIWRLATRVLTREQHAALWLRYAEELSIPEVASVLGRKETTVRVILFRARARLGDRLEERPRPGPARVADRALLRNGALGTRR